MIAVHHHFSLCKVLQSGFDPFPSVCMQIHLKDSIKTYNYMCRILLERVSWFLKAHNSKADVMLSGRGTKRDGELIHYIEEKLIRYDYNMYHLFISSILFTSICNSSLKSNKSSYVITFNLIRRMIFHIISDLLSFMITPG